MSAPPVTAAAIRGAFLHPVMDARAHNLDQDRLLFNPSPEADSLIEHLKLLESGHLRSSHGELARLAQALVASNAAEGLEEMAVAGLADQLVCDLRRFELNGGSRHPLAAKSIARRLRDPLTHLARPAGLDAAVLVDAGAAIAGVLETVPTLQLLGPSVRRELGEARYSLLIQLVESRQTTGAAQWIAADAQARESSHAPG